MHDAIRAYHSAGSMFGQAASWTRSGEGAGEVAGGLPNAGPIRARAITSRSRDMYGVLHQDIRKFSTRWSATQPVDRAAGRGCTACYG